MAYKYEERALLVAVGQDKTKRTQRLERILSPVEAHEAALREMMNCAYPHLNDQHEEYKQRLEDLQAQVARSRNWVRGQARSPSFIWMFPSENCDSEE